MYTSYISHFLFYYYFYNTIDIQVVTILLLERMTEKCYGLILIFPPNRTKL